MLVPKPFAIMRHRGVGAALTRWTRLLFVGVLSVFGSTAWAAQAPADSADAGPALSDSSDAGPDREWLPVPEEDLVNPEALEEDRSRLRKGALVRGTVAGGRFDIRRIALRGEGRELGVEAGFLFDRERIRPGVAIVAGHGRLAVAAGRVSLARLPPLLAEGLGLARSGRRVASPRWGAIAAIPSVGASAGAIDGASATTHGRTALWSFAGARPTGEVVAGVGLGVARGRIRASAALGGTSRSKAGFGSVTLVRRRDGSVVALEALAGTNRRAVLANVSARGEALSIGARWRYRSWTDRKVAAELSAETTGSSAAKIRLSWRSWSTDAVADDGLLELEAAGRCRGAPVRFRLGGTGFRAAAEASGAREVYGLIDATVARDGARSLSLHALRRAAATAGASAFSSTVGAKLEAGGGRLGDHALLVESTRLRKGVPAWGIALAPSGDVTLRSRSRPGLWIATRGSIGGGSWRLGYALERAEDGGGPKPWNGSVWIQRNTE